MFVCRGCLVVTMFVCPVRVALDGVLCTSSVCCPIVTVACDVCPLAGRYSGRMCLNLWASPGLGGECEKVV